MGLKTVSFFGPLREQAGSDFAEHHDGPNDAKNENRFSN
jgi:hypothetical protein